MSYAFWLENNQFLNAETLLVTFHWRSNNFSVLLICHLVKAVNVQTVTLCLSAILQNGNCLVVSTPKTPDPRSELCSSNTFWNSQNTEQHSFSLNTASSFCHRDTLQGERDMDYPKHKLSMVYFHHSTH